MNYVPNHKIPYYIGTNSVVLSVFYVSVHWLSIMSWSHFLV